MLFGKVPKSLREATGTIASQLQGSSLLFLIGAGISMDSPSNLPSAKEFVNTIIDRIIHSAYVQKFSSEVGWDNNKLDEIFNHFKKIQLEFLFYTLQESAGAEVNCLIGLLDSRHFNNNHSNIIKLAREFGLYGGSGIITTNFDTLLEQAAKDLGHCEIGRTTEKEFLDAYSSSISPIFKFHGSVERFDTEGAPNIGIDQLAQNKNNYKGKFINSLFTDIPNLVVLGYGGSDVWDLYPLLFQGVKGNLIWINHIDNGFSFQNTMLAKELTFPRSHIQRLISEQNDRYLISCPTNQFIELLCKDLGVEPRPKSTSERNLKYMEKKIDTWVRNRNWKIYLDFANLFRILGMNNEMHSMLQYAYNRFGDQLNNESKIQVLINLGEHYNTNFKNSYTADKEDRNKYLEEQLQFFELAEKLAKEIKEETLVFSIKLEKAIFLVEIGMKNFAKQIFHELSNKIPHCKNESLYAKYLADIGLNLLLTSYSKEIEIIKNGQELLKKATEIQLKTGDYNLLIESSYSLAQSYDKFWSWSCWEVYNTEEALYYYLLAGAIAHAKGIRKNKVDEIITDTLALLLVINTVKSYNAVDVNSQVINYIPNSEKLLKEHKIAYSLGFSELLISMLIKNPENSYEHHYRQLSEWWSEKGIALISVEKYEEALTYFDKIIKVKPSNIYAWLNRGLALCKLNRGEEAISCYEMAIEINCEVSDVFMLWRDKGIAYAHLEKYEEAVFCYYKALEKNPKDISTWYNRGISYSKLKLFISEIRCYDKVLEIDPNHCSALKNKGISLYDLGKKKEAIECFKKAAKLHDPDAIDFLSQLKINY